MRQEKSISELMLGIKWVLTKNRVSLTTKEIESLEDVLSFLEEIEEVPNDQEIKALIIHAVLLIMKFFLTEGFHSCESLLHHLLN